MSNTLNRLLDEAICQFANASDHLHSTRNTAQMHAQRETEALKKVNEAQLKIDNLYEQMRSLAPKGSNWHTDIADRVTFQSHVLRGLAGLRYVIVGHKNEAEWEFWIEKARKLAHRPSMEEALAPQPKPQSAPSPDIYGWWSS